MLKDKSILLAIIHQRVVQNTQERQCIEEKEKRMQSNNNVSGVVWIPPYCMVKINVDVVISDEACIYRFCCSWQVRDISPHGVVKRVRDSGGQGKAACFCFATSEEVWLQSGNARVGLSFIGADRASRIPSPSFSSLGITVEDILFLRGDFSVCV